MFLDKNLLVITNGYPCGESESFGFVKSQVDELKKFFANIYVIAPMPYAPKMLKKVSFLHPKFKIPSLMKDYSYENVKVFFPSFLTLPVQHFKDSFRGDLAYHAVKKTISKHKLEFHIIHSHFTWTSGYIASRLKDKYKKNYVLTIHENKSWLLEELESSNKKFLNAWQMSEMLFRVNRQDLNVLKQYNPNTMFLPNGFDKLFENTLSKQDCRNILKINNEKKIILNVANFKIAQKNQINLIKSLEKLRQKRDDFCCFLIGNIIGGDQQKIRSYITDNNADDFIFMLGEKKLSDVALWMKAADLFYFPSVSESFGIVNIEALISGTPVVSTINGGSEEILISEEYGFLARDYENIDELAQLVDQALDKDWDKTKLVQYAQTFRMNQVVEKLLDVYKNIIH